MKPPTGYRWRSRDAAHRMRDGLAFHQTVLTTDELMAGRWAVIRLSDGHVEPTAFDTHADAMKHAPGLESLYAYFRIPPEPMPAQACDVILWYVRTAYDNGWRPDPVRPEIGLIIPQLRLDGSVN